MSLKGTMARPYFRTQISIRTLPRPSQTWGPARPLNSLSLLASHNRKPYQMKHLHQHTLRFVSTRHWIRNPPFQNALPRRSPIGKWALIRPRTIGKTRSERFKRMKRSPKPVSGGGVEQSANESCNLSALPGGLRLPPVCLPLLELEEVSLRLSIRRCRSLDLCKVARSRRKRDSP